jgi:hypothetical protein
MEPYISLSGVTSQNPSDYRFGGMLEVSHCDRGKPVCVDLGGGIQAGWASAQSPNTVGSGRTLTIRDFDAYFVGYHGRLGFLANPSSAFGFGPVFRGGAMHYLGTETVFQNEKFQENSFHDAGFFLTGGVQMILTGKVLGVGLELGAASYPTMPEHERKAGFYAQLGGRVQF